MLETMQTDDESAENAPDVELSGDTIKPTDVEIEYDLEVGFLVFHRRSHIQKWKK